MRKQKIEAKFKSFDEYQAAFFPEKFTPQEEMVTVNPRSLGVELATKSLNKLPSLVVAGS